MARDPGEEKGYTALFMAARGLGNAEIVRMLVEAGSDPNPGEAIGFTPAGEAAARGAGDVLEVLVEAGADLHVPGGSKSIMELVGRPMTRRPCGRWSRGYWASPKGASHPSQR